VAERRGEVERAGWTRLVQERLFVRDVARGCAHVVLAGQSSGGERHATWLSEERRRAAEQRRRTRVCYSGVGVASASVSVKEICPLSIAHLVAHQCTDAMG
jgi:hypothetical protein